MNGSYQWIYRVNSSFTFLVYLYMEMERKTVMAEDDWIGLFLMWNALGSWFMLVSTKECQLVVVLKKTVDFDLCKCLLFGG